MKNFIQKVPKSFFSVADISVWIGYAALAAIILIVMIDVCGRFLLNKPLPGSYELVLLAMTVLGGFAIMYTAVKKGHVAIDLLVIRFPRKVRVIMQIATSLLGAITSGVLAYQIYLQALRVLESSGKTDLLHIQQAPFFLALAVAVFLCFLTLLIQTFHPVLSDEQPKERDDISQ